jgi:type IV secretory pathway VirB2 component (pilin)
MSIIKQTVEYVSAKFNMTGNEAWNVAFVFILVAAVMMIPNESTAAAQTVGTGSKKVADVICSIVKELQGPVARGVAAFGIIFLGFSLFLGKISWGVALALGIGIGAIFGAGQIVDMFAGSASQTGAATCA